MNNPYSIVFGQVPRQMISRIYPLQTVLNSFLHDNPQQHVYMITGVRGSGKTVFMTEAENEIRLRDNWIVIDLIPDEDMLRHIILALGSEKGLFTFFQNARIDLSFFGIGVHISDLVPEKDPYTALLKMLQTMKAHGRRLLVTVDEASSTKELRQFAGYFQNYIRNDLPIYLLMTGLFENISELQNEKNLTFLYRAPKLLLAPLNISGMADNYQSTFQISKEQALGMAKLTMGYSFAFQVLGALTWDASGDYLSVIPRFRQTLEEYSYEKIWSELSAADQAIAAALAKASADTGEPVRVSKVREIAGYDSNRFNQYRKRLIRQGIVNGDTYGYLSFTLPMFREFVLDNAAE